MCASFTPSSIWENDFIGKRLRNAGIPPIQGSFARVYPHNLAPVLYLDEEVGLTVQPGEFSLVPSWFNPEKHKSKGKLRRPAFATYNARIEDIENKPSFRDSFQHHHCLIAMHSFYESATVGRFAGNMIEFSFSAQPLLAAGVFSFWLDRITGEEVLSFAIITTAPPAQVEDAGHDRCPLLLSAENGLEFVENKNMKPTEIKRFLLTKFETPDFDIKTDRPLKSGWEKRS